MNATLQQELLDATIEEYDYYNITNMPFDYKKFICNEELLNSAHIILQEPNEEIKENEKEILLRIIYTNLYKLNLNRDAVTKYFEKALLTDKFKTYLITAFKFYIQYNQDEEPVVTTFIHLAQLFLSDIVYDYLWKLENYKESK